jgi:aryl-alcohol dehydrogenase-like predicted oxidoreductase
MCVVEACVCEYLASFCKYYCARLSNPGTSNIDVLLIHDLDQNFFTPKQEAAHLASLSSSGVRALDELKRCGHISVIGSGINRADAIHTILDHADLDCLLISQVYTLGDHSAMANGGMQRCEREQIGVMAATVFNSGAMFWDSGNGGGGGGGGGGRIENGSGSEHKTTPPFNYAPMTQDQMAQVKGLYDVCER